MYVWMNVCEFTGKLIEINGCLGLGMDGVERRKHSHSKGNVSKSIVH